MKILILATPRSGSTSLTNLIYFHLNQSEYTLFIEPFNPNFYSSYKSKGFDFETTYPLEKFKNLLVKTLLLSDNNEFPSKSFDNIESYLEWCTSFFDKIILLDRNNRISQSESFAFNETMFRKYGIGWHTPKKYNISEIDPSYIQTMISRYEKSGKILSDISHIQKYPIFYYEDIFEFHNKDLIKKMFDYLGIKLIDSYYNEFVLSPSKKVRIDNSVNKII